MTFLLYMMNYHDDLLRKAALLQGIQDSLWWLLSRVYGWMGPCTPGIVSGL